MVAAILILCKTIMLLISSTAAAITYNPVSNSFSPGTESQVISFVSEDAIGSFNQLIVGSTYIANRISIASNSVKTYFFFKPTLKTPLAQGNVLDSGVISLVKILMLESKQMIGISDMTSQRARNMTMAYDALSDVYSKVSMTTNYHTGFSPFFGLTADPTAIFL